MYFVVFASKCISSHYAEQNTEDDTSAFPGPDWGDLEVCQEESVQEGAFRYSTYAILDKLPKATRNSEQYQLGPDWRDLTKFQALKCDGTILIVFVTLPGNMILELSTEGTKYPGSKVINSENMTCLKSTSFIYSTL